MAGNIRLSPKHGVNPMVLQCFVCGEDTGVALLGKLKGDAEAPRVGVLDKESCEKCRGFMAQGIILISTRDGEESDNPYRTGGWVVVTEDMMVRLLPPGALLEDILRCRMAFLPDEVWNMIGLPR